MRESLDAFFTSQLKDWNLLAENYDGLSRAVIKTINMGGFQMQVQFNPERIHSSAAKVDIQSIKERKCFLCKENLPSQQKRLSYPPDYLVLVNPYPIFPKHFTIVCDHHTDQLIEGRISDILSLARDMDDFVVFYNGPESGASAPDHFHFQAGTKGIMEIEKDFSDYSGKSLLRREENGAMYEMQHYLRKTLVLKSEDSQWIIDQFENIFRQLKKIQPEKKEPMLNFMASFNGKSWTLFLFPRIKHRPSQYFEEGEKQILFSPGAVDFGGLLITPREEDFYQLDKTLITDMFSQITYTDEMWTNLLHMILSDKQANEKKHA